MVEWREHSIPHFPICVYLVSACVSYIESYVKGFVYLCFIFVFMKFDYKDLERIVFKAVDITLLEVQDDVFFLLVLSIMLMNVSFAKVDLITILIKFFGDIMELREGI